MSTDIDEPLKTGVIFDRQLIRPAWFVWNGRRYAVRQVTQRWQTKEGQAPILHVGVTDGASTFELTLNQHSLIWRLAAVEANGCA